MPKQSAPICRPSGSIVEVTLFDEAGRAIVFTVQVTAAGVSCWTSDSNGGTISVPALFTYCCQSQSAARAAHV